MHRDKLKGIKEHNKKMNEILRDSIRDALLLLMERMQYEKISISDLCKAAGVSRTGFYTNYSSKDRVLSEIVDKLMDEINRTIGPQFTGHYDLQWYIDFFELVRKNARVYKIIYESGFQGKYLQLVNVIILNHPDIDDKEKFRRLMWNGAIQNAAFSWLEGGMLESALDMATWCHAYLEK
jgi:Transcriptional regulator